MSGAIRPETTQKNTMKKYSLTVAGKSVNFIQREDEDFNEALSRGAAKLGYRGGAFAQPNFSCNHQVAVLDRAASRASNARQSYNGVCSEL